MTRAEEIQQGHLCMMCQRWLFDEHGALNDCGHPVYCKDCWEELGPKDRDAPYYDDETGTVCTG